MGRLVLIAMILTSLQGCSPKEQATKVTRAEFAEFQSHLPLDSQPTEEQLRFLASARGKDIVSRRLRMIFSDRGIAILRGASRVETFRIVDPELHPEAGGPRTVERFPITDVGPQQGAPFAARLADAVLDGKDYFISLDCWPDPGVAFRAWKGKESVTLAICYECDDLEVSVRDPRGVQVHHGGGSFHDPLGGPVGLVRLAKEAFPDDPSIQELSDETTRFVPVTVGTGAAR